MIRTDFEFFPTVSRSGYRWLQGPWHFLPDQPPATALLTSGEDSQSSQRVPRPDLETVHREFSTLGEPDRSSTNFQQAILKFVEQHGFLGVDQRHRPGPGADAAEGYQIWGLEGESLEAWQAEIGAVRHVLEILDAARNGDHSTLARFLEVRNRKTNKQFTVRMEGWYYKSPSPDLFPSFSGKPIHGAGPLDQTRIAVVAIGLVAQMVEYQIHAGTKGLETHLVTRPVHSSPGDTPTVQARFVLNVPTLRMMIWLAVALELLEPRDYRRCQVCHRWFTLDEDGRKAKQRFCSKPCKSRDQRERKKEVATLAGQGLGEKEIAERMEMSLKTIRNWLGRGKARPRRQQ